MPAMMINHKLMDESNREVVPWWSFGKTVLATAIYKLVEQNRLNLDSSYFGLKGSLKQILRHEAGLKDYYSHKDYHNAVNGNVEPWSFEEMIEKLKATELLFEPGSGWMYSNIGYAYIRKIIEVETKQTLQEALQTLIFNSIGIYEVKVATEPEDLKDCSNVDKGYHPGWLYHGLIIGELKHAIQFLDALAEGKIISKDNFNKMCESYKLDFDIGNRPWKNPGYAHGLMVDDRPDKMRSLGHTGTGPGSTIAVYHFPDGTSKITLAASKIEKEQSVSEYEVFNMIKTMIR